MLISHDRHLLRTVCDELLVVHEGTVERFEQTLDDYPAWLADQKSEPLAASRRPARQGDASAPALPVNKKLQRQLEAQRRQALKPVADKLRDIEGRLAACREQLEALDGKLADPALYADPERTREMTDLVRNQAALRAEVESLETQWLDASEALESAQAEAPTDSRA
jgi:ATP-binding cassette subfamily F protein 3